MAENRNCKCLSRKESIAFPRTDDDVREDDISQSNQNEISGKPGDKLSIYSTERRCFHSDDINIGRLFGTYKRVYNSFRRDSRIRHLNTQMLEAIENDDIDDIVRLEQVGASLNATCQLEQVSACHLAALKNNESLSILISLGALGLRIDKHGRTPLHLAAWAGNTKQIAVLLGFSKDLQNSVETVISQATANEIKANLPSTNLINMPVGSGCDSTTPREWIDNMVHNCRRMKEILPTLESGWTALHAASTRAHFISVQLLLAAGANPCVQDATGKSPLDIVGHAYFSQYKIDANENTIKILLAAGGNMNKANSQHLHIAVALESKEAIKELLNSGFPTNCLDNYGRTPMHICVEKRNTQFLQIIANFKNTDEDVSTLTVDAQDINGLTVLHAAVVAMWAHGVLIALEAGASIAIMAKNGDSPLHTAAAIGDVDILQGLLTVGKYAVDLCNEIGLTALFIAVKHNHLEAVQMLIENGASVRIVRVIRLNVLHIAAAQGYLEIMEFLFNHKGENNVSYLINDIAQVDRCTPIVYAIENSQKACIDFLLRKGAQINFLVPYGDNKYKEGKWTTPLHIAVIKNNIDIIKMLLHFDSSILNMPDSAGYLPIHEACIKGNRETISLLIHQGGDLAAESSTLVTPMNMLLHNLIKPEEYMENILDSYISGEGLQERDFEVTVNYQMLLPRTSGENQMRVVNSLLRASSTHNQRQLLQHPLIESFLFLKWKKLLPFFYFIVFLYVWFTLSLNIYVVSLFYYNDKNTPNVTNTSLPVHYTYNITPVPVYFQTDVWKYMIYVSASILILQEVFFLKVRRCLVCLETAMKFTTIILSLTLPTLVHWHTEPEVDPEKEVIRLIATITILLSWLEMMFLISRFPDWGFYVLIFVKVTTKVLKIMLTYGVLIIGFAFGFMIQFRAESPFESPWASITKTLVMMTSEYDYMTTINKESSHGHDASITMQRLIFLTFVILASVVLMNLMVGVAVNDVNNLVKIGTRKRLEELVDFLTSLEDIVCNNITPKIIPGSRNVAIFKSTIVPSTIVLRPQDLSCSCTKMLPHHIKEALFEKAYLKTKQKDDECNTIKHDNKIDKVQDDIVTVNERLQQINTDMENIKHSLEKMQQFLVNKK